MVFAVCPNLSSAHVSRRFIRWTKCREMLLLSGRVEGICAAHGHVVVLIFVPFLPLTHMDVVIYGTAPFHPNLDEHAPCVSGRKKLEHPMTIIRLHQICKLQTPSIPYFQAISIACSTYSTQELPVDRPFPTRRMAQKSGYLTAVEKSATIVLTTWPRFTIVIHHVHEMN